MLNEEKQWQETNYEKTSQKISTIENNRWTVPEKRSGYKNDNHLFTIKNGYEIADHHELRNAQARPYQK